MSKTTLHQQLVTRLAPLRGMHAKIARECGFSQSTISRVSLGKCSPTLAVAEPIFAWLDQNAPAAATGHTKRMKRIARTAAPGPSP